MSIGTKWSHRKGPCESCNLCIKCLAGPECHTPEKHPNTSSPQDRLLNLNKKAKTTAATQAERDDEEGDDDDDEEEEAHYLRRVRAAKSKGSFVEPRDSQRNVSPSYFNELCQLLDMQSVPIKVQLRKIPLLAATLGTAEGKQRFGRFLEQAMHSLAVFICPDGPEVVFNIVKERQQEAKSDKRAVDMIADVFCRTSNPDVKRAELAKLHTLLRNAEAVKAVVDAAFKRRQVDLGLDPLQLVHGVGREGRSAALADYDCLINGNNLPQTTYTSRIEETAVRGFVVFASSFLDGVRPGKLKASAAIGGVILRNIPYFLRLVSIQKLYEQYVGWIDVGKWEQLGKNSFFTLISVLTKRAKQEVCVDTYFARFSIACTVLKLLLARGRVLLGHEPSQDPAPAAPLPAIVGDQPNDNKSECSWISDDDKAESSSDEDDSSSEEEEEEGALGNPAGDALAILFQQLDSFFDSTMASARHHYTTALSSFGHNSELGHCLPFAFGACTKKHEAKCTDCKAIHSFGPKLQSMSKSLQTSHNSALATMDPADGQKRTAEIESLVRAAKRASATLIYYAAHRMRATHQTRSVQDLISNLPENEFVIITDFKNKVLPQKSIESQVDYFGKKGMSLLGFYVLQRVGLNLVPAYVDMVLDLSQQGTAMVQSCVRLLLLHLVGKHGSLSAYFVSDNATCYNSMENVPFITEMQGVNWGIPLTKGTCTLRSWTFFEPQTGKSQCDTHFSYVGNALRSFVNAGHDMTTPRDIFDALKEYPIANATILLVKVVLPEQAGNKKKKFPVDGSQRMSEIKYSNDGKEVHFFEQTGLSFVHKLLVGGRLEMGNIKVVDYLATAKRNHKRCFETEILDKVEHAPKTASSKSAVSEKSNKFDHFVGDSATSTDKLLADTVMEFLGGQLEQYETRYEKDIMDLDEILEEYSLLAAWALKKNSQLLKFIVPEWAKKKIKEAVSGL